MHFEKPIEEPKNSSLKVDRIPKKTNGRLSISKVDSDSVQLVRRSVDDAGVGPCRWQQDDMLLCAS